MSKIAADKKTIRDRKDDALLLIIKGKSILQKWTATLSLEGIGNTELAKIAHYPSLCNRVLPKSYWGSFSACQKG